MTFPNGTRLTKERFPDFTSIWIIAVDSRILLHQTVSSGNGYLKKGHTFQDVGALDARLNLAISLDIDRKQFVREAKRITKMPIYKA